MSRLFPVLSYSTLISVDLAQHEIFRAKFVISGKDGIIASCSEIAWQKIAETNKKAYKSLRPVMIKLVLGGGHFIHLATKQGCTASLCKISML